MPKIFLVEDDNNLREIFEMRLQAEGYKTVTAGDGEEALTVAIKEKPDLVIADVMMPKLSGFEMVENMRAHAELSQVKVIMMTALGQAEDKARGEKLGVVKYLVKSQVTLEDFVRVVREVLPPTQDGAAAVASAQPDNTANPAPENNSNNKQESENPMPEDNQTPSTPPADAGAAGTNPISGAPADAGAAPASDAGAQTTAQEQSTVNDQINNFAAGSASAPAADAAAAAPGAPAVPESGDVPVSTPPASDPAAPSRRSSNSTCKRSFCSRN